MIAFEDESLERELFALRAPAIATPALDLDDVMTRASRPQICASPHAARFAAWASAIAVAAASYLGIGSHEPSHEADAVSGGASMSYFDGLSCRPDVQDVPDVVAPAEPGMCVAPNQLVCAVTFESPGP